MKRKIIAAMLCLALLAVCAVAETAGTKVFELGTSGYTIAIPESFVEGERTEEEIEDDMVAYMKSPDTLLDFDVYQLSKEGFEGTLADYVALEAAEYDASEVVTDVNINGIDIGWYRAVEAYDDQEYTTLTYVMQSGNDCVEIVFWLDGDDAEAEAQAIIDTLAKP